MSHPTTCRSCGAPIVWGITDKGRRMPLDSAPDPDGEWTVTTWGDLEHATADTPVGERRISHFATCPQGRAWSDRRKRGAA